MAHTQKTVALLAGFVGIAVLAITLAAVGQRAGLLRTAVLPPRLEGVLISVSDAYGADPRRPGGLRGAINEYLRYSAENPDQYPPLDDFTMEVSSIPGDIRCYTLFDFTLSEGRQTYTTRTSGRCGDRFVGASDSLDGVELNMTGPIGVIERVLRAYLRQDIDVMRAPIWACKDSDGEYILNPYEYDQMFGWSIFLFYSHLNRRDSWVCKPFDDIKLG